MPFKKNSISSVVKQQRPSMVAGCRGIANLACFRGICDLDRAPADGCCRGPTGSAMLRLLRRSFRPIEAITLCAIAAATGSLTLT